MRRMVGRRYSLAELLLAQPKTIQRSEDYGRLRRMLRDSQALRRTRLPRHAYLALNAARIEKENFEAFRQANHLPESLFFELFLSVKKRYSEKRLALAERKWREIVAVMETYPREVVGFMRYVAKVEGTRNPAIPIWKTKLFPGTKKRAREMSAFTTSEWIRFLDRYVNTLEGAYRRLPLGDREKLWACMLLECLPDPEDGRLPSREKVRSRFRALSLVHHPDAGGDARRFLLIQKARDVLLD